MLDEGWEAGDGGLIWDFEPVGGVVPEGDAELGAGFGQSEEGIAAIATGLAAGAAADLSLDDVAADIALRSVGVERDLRPIENHQQFGLVGVQPGEQAIERDEAGSALEDAVEPCPHLGLAAARRLTLVGEEVAVEPPDQGAQRLLGPAAVLGEGIELMDGTLGMDPAQRVMSNVELSGVVADDHGLAQEAVRPDAAEQCPF